MSKGTKTQEPPYRERQAAMDRAYIAACKAAGIKPLIYHDSASPTKGEDRDPTKNAPAPGGSGPNQDFCFFDEKVESEAPIEYHTLAAEAVLRVLQVLTGSEHPSLRLSADCLLALINRSEEKSQAEIARRYGLTRAAISKRMRDMRRGRFLQGLEIYFFGGREDVSQKARERAIRVHAKNKSPNTQCKTTPTPQLTSFLQKLAA